MEECKMNNGTASKSSSFVTEKMIFIHMIFIATVCLLFGVMNLISKFITIGVITLAMGVIVPLTVIVLKNKLSLISRGMILTQAQLLAIIYLQRKARAARNVLTYACINGGRLYLFQ